MVWPKQMATPWRKRLDTALMEEAVNQWHRQREVRPPWIKIPLSNRGLPLKKQDPVKYDRASSWRCTHCLTWHWNPMCQNCRECKKPRESAQDAPHQHLKTGKPSSWERRKNREQTQGQDSEVKEQEAAEQTVPRKCRPAEKPPLYAEVVARLARKEGNAEPPQPQEQQTPPRQEVAELLKKLGEEKMASALLEKDKAKAAKEQPTGGSLAALRQTDAYLAIARERMRAAEAHSKVIELQLTAARAAMEKSREAVEEAEKTRKVLIREIHETEGGHEPQQAQQKNSVPSDVLQQVKSLRTELEKGPGLNQEQLVALVKALVHTVAPPEMPANEKMRRSGSRGRSPGPRREDSSSRSPRRSQWEHAGMED